EDDDNPYYDDTIMKYMSHTQLSKFDQLTYPQYYESYSITPSSPGTTPRQIYRDALNNYVVKRS
ncbi:21600_t:CDS:1, partial [Rhizophagus irregularis]